MGIEVILAALVAGAAAASTDIATQAIKDAYSGFKTLLRQRFGGRIEAEVALAQHETKPDSWKDALKAELAAAGADKDEAILEAAHRLQKLAQAELINVSASGPSAIAVGQAETVASGDARVVAPEFHGPVSNSALAIAGGDVTGGVTNTSGVTDQTMALLFEPILAEIRARPADPAAPNIKVRERVESIRDEAARGQSANAVRIAGWLGELGALAPDVKGLVISAIRKAGGAIANSVRDAVDQVAGTEG